tara:strand:- start:1368 stop:1640 length:273 start_codon:yes stop_codon:yes gene_type:complete
MPEQCENDTNLGCSNAGGAPGTMHKTDSKTPKLFPFYWNDASEQWEPVPENIKAILCTDNIGPGKEVTIRFTQLCMSEEEFERLRVMTCI